MKKKTLGILILFFILTSCVKKSDKYFLHTQHKLFGLERSDYVLAELHKDSIVFRFIGYGVVGGLYASKYPKETLPAKPFKGKHVIIKEIGSNFILADVAIRRRTDTILFKEIKIKKTKKISKYHKLINEVQYTKVFSQFNDSIKKIMDIRTENIDFTHLIRDDYSKKLILQTSSDTFPKLLKLHLNNNLESIKQLQEEKKEFYIDLEMGNILLDSASFSKFIDNYEHGFYDRRSLYHFITHKPELICLNIQYLNRIKFDVAYCEECFTMKELDEMRLKLLQVCDEGDDKLKWFYHRRYVDELLEKHE